MLFRKKKKKRALFGAGISPDCAYCQHNSGGPEKVLCSLRSAMTDGKCKQFHYDPLLREPQSPPALRTEGYTEEDFKL